MLLPMLLLMFACALKSTHALPTLATDDPEPGRSNAVPRSDIPMTYVYSDEYDDDTLDQPASAKQQQRFKVVRNPNGTLGLVINAPTTTTTTTTTVASDIVFSNHNSESPEDYDDVEDGDLAGFDTMMGMMSHVAGKTSRQLADTFGAYNTHEQVMMDDDVHSRPPRATDNIVFPDSDAANQFRATQCSNNKTFCDDASGYPTDAIEALIGSDVNRYKGLFDTDQPGDLAMRFAEDDDDLNETPMCDRVIMTKWPKTGLTKDNTWAYIVNSDKYKQGVRVEECKAADQPCNFAKNFANGVRTQCRQLFMFRKLLAVKEENSPPETMMFQFPSCCQCRVSTHAANVGG